MDLTVNTPSFGNHLFDCIRLQKNLELVSLLTKEVHDVVDHWGSLLHYSVFHGNLKVTRLLIKLGWDVNLVEKNQSNRTPLIIAVELGHASIVKILVETDAKFIEFPNENGVTALELAFDPSHSHPIVVESFLHKLQSIDPSIEKMIEWLYILESSLYEAFFLRDTQILKRMLKLGFHVDSQGHRQRTALHAAVELGDLRLDNDAEVDAKDANGLTPLSLLYERDVVHSPERLFILQLLIGHGASLDTYTSFGCPLVLPIVTYGDAKVLRLLLLDNDLDLALTDEKDEKSTIGRVHRLLLEHGADSRLLEYDSTDPTIFDFALYDGDYRKINFIIAHLAKMEVLGKPIDQFTRREIQRISEFRKYLRSCRQILRKKIVAEMTLSELLNVTDDQLKILLRNRDFVSELRRVGCKVELKETFSYYFEFLGKRVFEISPAMRLKYEATVTLCANLGGQYNVCYDVAEMIVGNLEAKDVERLCQL